VLSTEMQFEDIESLKNFKFWILTFSVSFKWGGNNYTDNKADRLQPDATVH
jgi:hypothetical protein